MAQSVVGFVSSAGGHGPVRVFVDGKLYATVGAPGDGVLLVGVLETHVGEGRDVWHPVIRGRVFLEAFGPLGSEMSERPPEEVVGVAESYAEAVEAASLAVQAMKPRNELDEALSRLKEVESRLAALEAAPTTAGAPAAGDAGGVVEPGN
jgi:hypothetical protein